MGELQTSGRYLSLISHLQSKRHSRIKYRSHDVRRYCKQQVWKPNFEIADFTTFSQNPFPGAIYNYPGGPNEYPGVVIDYRRDDVNSTNFLNILTGLQMDIFVDFHWWFEGNKEAMKNVGSGKVIESGPNDKVFVYFSDHGGPGLLAFPSDDDTLSVQNFSAAIKSMKENSKVR